MNFSTIKREIQKIIEFEDPSEIQLQSFASGFVRTNADGQAIRRPVYVFFGANFIVVDFPFALLDEVDRAEEYSAMWAVGATDGKLTVHNVFIPQSFENGLLQISEAIRLMAAEAAKHEFAITGQRLFLDSEISAPGQVEIDQNSDLIICDDCGKKYSEDEINYFEGESDEDGWTALCENCSAT